MVGDDLFNVFFTLDNVLHSFLTILIRFGFDAHFTEIHFNDSQDSKIGEFNKSQLIKETWTQKDAQTTA